MIMELFKASLLIVFILDLYVVCVLPSDVIKPNINDEPATTSFVKTITDKINKFKINSLYTAAVNWLNNTPDNIDNEEINDVNNNMMDYAPDCDIPPYENSNVTPPPNEVPDTPEIVHPADIGSKEDTSPEQDDDLNDVERNDTDDKFKASEVVEAEENIEVKIEEREGEGYVEIVADEYVRASVLSEIIEDVNVFPEDIDAERTIADGSTKENGKDEEKGHNPEETRSHNVESQQVEPEDRVRLPSDAKPGNTYKVISEPSYGKRKFGAQYENRIELVEHTVTDDTVAQNNPIQRTEDTKAKSEYGIKQANVNDVETEDVQDMEEDADIKLNESTPKPPQNLSLVTIEVSEKAKPIVDVKAEIPKPDAGVDNDQNILNSPDDPKIEYTEPKEEVTTNTNNPENGDVDKVENFTKYSIVSRETSPKLDDPINHLEKDGVKGQEKVVRRIIQKPKIDLKESVSDPKVFRKIGNKNIRPKAKNAGRKAPRNMNPNSNRRRRDDKFSPKTNKPIRSLHSKGIKVNLDVKKNKPGKILSLKENVKMSMYNVRVPSYATADAKGFKNKGRKVRNGRNKINQSKSGKKLINNRNERTPKVRTKMKQVKKRVITISEESRTTMYSKRYSNKEDL